MNLKSKLKKNLAKNLILIAMLSAVGTFSVASGYFSFLPEAAPLGNGSYDSNKIVLSVDSDSEDETITDTEDETNSDEEDGFLFAKNGETVIDTYGVVTTMKDGIVTDIKVRNSTDNEDKTVTDKEEYDMITNFCISNNEEDGETVTDTEEETNSDEEDGFLFAKKDETVVDIKVRNFTDKEEYDMVTNFCISNKEEEEKEQKPPRMSNDLMREMRQEEKIKKEAKVLDQQDGKNIRIPHIRLKPVNLFQQNINQNYNQQPMQNMNYNNRFQQGMNQNCNGKQLMVKVKNTPQKINIEQVQNGNANKQKVKSIAKLPFTEKEINELKDVIIENNVNYTAEFILSDALMARLQDKDSDQCALEIAEFLCKPSDINKGRIIKKKSYRELKRSQGEKFKTALRLLIMKQNKKV